MAMEGTLKNRNGKLYVLYTSDEYSEPFRQYLWWRVLETHGTGYGERPEAEDIAASTGGGGWRTRNPSTHRATGTVSTGTGSTKAETVERVSLNPPSTGGKELRWHDGRWEKLMARGWVPAGEGGKTKSKKASTAHATKQGAPTKATLKALDAIDFGDPVAPATRTRLVREGLVTEGGRLTDRGQQALDRRLAHEVLGRDHATKKKSSAQLQKEIDAALSKPAHASRAHSDQQIAEAIDSGSREQAADLYGLWTSRYSNEDLDRVSSLANRLTAVDRQEGRSSPPVGSSKSRLSQAEQVVSDANRYSAFQQRRRKH